MFLFGFGIWEDFESTGNGCGNQMSGFSAQTKSYLCLIFHDVSDASNFAIVFGGLVLLQENPGTS